MNQGKLYDDDDNGNSCNTVHSSSIIMFVATSGLYSVFTECNIREE